MKILNIKNKKAWIYVACALALVLAISAGTAAYLVSQSEKVDNEFVPSFVACEVQQTLDGITKKDISVKNTGNINAYIRATVIINYVDVNDESRVWAIDPKENVDYTIVFGDPRWIKGADGFWYYTSSIEPEAYTENLIDSITDLGKAPSGFQLSVKVLVAAIQSDPVSVVIETWGVTESGGRITPIS